MQTKSIKNVIDKSLAGISAHSKAFFTRQPVFVKYIVFLISYFYYAIFKKASLRRAVKMFDNSGMIHFQNSMKIYENWFLGIFETIIEQRVRFMRIFKVEVVPIEIASETEGKTISVPLPLSKSIECFLFMKKDRMKQV